MRHLVPFLPQEACSVPNEGIIIAVRRLSLPEKMKAWLIIAFFLALLPLGAQEVNPLLCSSEPLTLGVGITLNTVRDQAHSAFTYSGKGMRIFLSFERIRPEWISRMGFSVDNVKLRARLKPRRDINRSAKLTDVQFNLGYYARLGTPNSADNQQYLGASFNMQTNSRNYPLPTNNQTGIMMQSSLAIGGVDRRTINGADDWTFTSRVSLPVFTALYRPAYIGIPPFLHIPKAEARDVLGNFKLVGPGKFFQPTFGVDADFQRKPWRTDRLSYDWNLFYTPLPETKPIMSTSGSLIYGFRVLL